jgi:hypothetical protein
MVTIYSTRCWDEINYLTLKNFIISEVCMVNNFLPRPTESDYISSSMCNKHNKIVENLLYYALNHLVRPTSIANTVLLATPINYTHC